VKRQQRPLGKNVEAATKKEKDPTLIFSIGAIPGGTAERRKKICTRAKGRHRDSFVSQKVWITVPTTEAKKLKLSH